ncbi:MAG: hypothetical protein J0H14_25430 [Alphaproteobacteria bacterium]|nr:hypothetical protein [Alphaproteobacteria bacterium]
MSRCIPRSVRPALATAALSAALLISLAPVEAAHAWWRGGFYVGIPGPVVVAPPPVYYPPPPVYYAPPPIYYPPPPGYPAPQSYAAAPGRTCYAGSYICPLAQAYTPGSACTCPTGRGLAYGQAR